MNTVEKKKPLTEAQKIFGKNFGNAQIITERQASLRSSIPAEDKILFQKYRNVRRNCDWVIKRCLR